MLNTFCSDLQRSMLRHILLRLIPQYLNNCLNKTFQVWLNTLRIEESKKLLTSSEKISIEEIGIRVGIPQNYNFSRWFRVITDMTPLQYRRLHHSGK